MTTTPLATSPTLIRPARLARLRLILLLLRGALTIATVYRWGDPVRRQALKQAWSARLIALCGVTLKVHTHGEVLSQGAMLVANHVSWLDIHVIDAWRPTPFVAKSEIESWPLIGWLARSAGTIYLQRQQRSDAKRVVEQLAAVLRADGMICIFAEGTTSDGLHVAPFHANLLQAAVTAGAPLQPLCLMYEDAHGNQSLAPAFVGDMSLAESLRRVLDGGPSIAHLHIGAPIRNLTDRRSAASTAHAAVTAALRQLQSGVRVPASVNGEADS